MISKSRFIMENILWLLEILKIFDLAIIISAAIRILNKIRVVDIVSIAENGEIDELIILKWSMLVVDIIVIIRSDAMVIHQ